MDASDQRSSFDSRITELENRLEALKTSFNQFFSGEIRIPPEQKRQELERIIRHLSSSGSRSPRQATLFENLVQKFNLYNNLWLKRLNELETGVQQIPRKKQRMDEKVSRPPVREPEGVELNLADERSFENLYQLYRSKTKSLNAPPMDKSLLTRTVQEKLKQQKLEKAYLTLSVENNRLKIKVGRKKS